MATATKSGTTWSYTYNTDGLRTGKTNGTDTYRYVYNGSQLTGMTKGTDTLHFTYDANGVPAAVTYNGTVYYYATNIQGDIVAILDSSGTAVVTYSYDAWGNANTPAGTMASTLGALNPLRYRGYVYDNETGLYYLQSRYYNPGLFRFINADAFTSTGQGLLGNNMFAYCGNNPVVFADYGGTRYVSVTAQLSGGSLVKTDISKDIPEPNKNIVKEISNYIFNDDEQAVLDSPGLSFYKGVPVVKLPINREAFSYGIIFLGDNVAHRHDAIETVQHEYGHALHYRIAGSIGYTICAFIPSVIGYHLGGSKYQANYYSYIYEYTADLLGGVNRNDFQYSSLTETFWPAYFLYSCMLP